MGAENAFIGKTYFDGDVQMPVPPEYFLQRLYDYDALLVLFPSIAHPGSYVVARRRERTRGLTGDAVLAGVTNPDTLTCVRMGWIPVCVMVQTGLSWNPDQIIARLQARDIRAHGGADKVADLLEEQETAEKVAQKKATRDDLWNRSGDAWRSYQARTGASSIRFNDTPVNGGDGRTAPNTPRSTAGLGAPDGATIGGEVS
jgi:hypothetical protein